MKKKFRFPTSQKGQSLVELAISITILVYLLSGAVEFGIAFFQFVQLRDAAQEGALYGSLNPPANSDVNDPNRLDIIERAEASSSSPIDLANDLAVNVEVEVTDGQYCEGGSLEVRITYPHQVFMPFIEVITGGTIPLTATVTDTILTPVCPPP